MKEEDKNKDKEKKHVPKVNSLTFEEYKEIYDNSWSNFQKIAIHLLREEMLSKPNGKHH